MFIITWYGTDVWPGPELVTNWVTLDNVQYAGQSMAWVTSVVTYWGGHKDQCTGAPQLPPPMPSHRPVGVTLAGWSKSGSPHTGHCLVTHISTYTPSSYFSLFHHQLYCSLAKKWVFLSFTELTINLLHIHLQGVPKKIGFRKTSWNCYSWLQNVYLIC